MLSETQQNEKAEGEVDVQKEVSPLTATLRSLDLDDVHIAFAATRKQPPLMGFDPNHIDITNLTLKGNDLHYSPSLTAANIQQLTFEEKSGLTVQDFALDFNMTDTSVLVKKLAVQTPHTQISNQTTLWFTSLHELLDNPAHAQVNVRFDKTSIGLQDVFLFVPDLHQNEMLAHLASYNLQFSGKIKGQVSDLNLSDIRLGVLESTQINLAGNIKGLPDAENAFYDIRLKQFKTTRKEIQELAPQGVIPGNIQLPDFLNAKGRFTGQINNFASIINIETDLGSAFAKTTLDGRVKDAEKYKAEIKIGDFALGKLLKNDSIGKVSLHAGVSGIGFNPRTASAELQGAIDYAEFNSYSYWNLLFSASIHDGDFNLMTNMDDENIDFSIKAKGSVREVYPSFSLQGEIKNVALHKLNLYDSVLIINGVIDADFSTADLDFLNGEIVLEKFFIATENTSIPLQNIFVKSTATETKNTILVQTPFLTASMQGQFQLSRLGNAIAEVINHYYPVQSTEDVLKEKTDEQVRNQFFQLDIDLHNDELFELFVPELELTHPIIATLKFNQKQQSIDLAIHSESFKYSSFVVNDLEVLLQAENNALDNRLNIHSVDGGSVVLPEVLLTGKLENQLLDFDLSTIDEEGRKQYRIGGDITLEEDLMALRFNPDKLLLDYQNWNVSEDNALYFSKEGVQIDNLLISRRNSNIHVFSTEKNVTSPIEIRFKNFDISTITEMVSDKDLLVGGIINGNISVANLNTYPEINGNLRLEKLSYMADTIGDVRLMVHNRLRDRIFSQLNITAFGNDVHIEGNYFIETQGLDYTLNIKSIALSSVEKFMADYVSETKGFLSGQMTVKGTVSNPEPLGNLKFNDIGLRVNMLNGYFHSMNDNIRLDKKGVHLDKFSVSDVNNNKLSVSGSVLTDNFSDFDLNLNILADNFMVLNSTVRDNNLYYGDLFFNTNLQIRGTPQSPVVRGSLAINERTNFTLVIPQQDPSVIEREGIVEFVDEVSLQIRQAEQLKDELSETDLKGFDVSVNLSINPNARFKVIVDEASGDNLQLKGNAQLNLGIDKSGTINLTGRYEFTEGVYELSFNFIRKRFKIQEGSYLVWSGDPLAANVNITAIYETQTAPIDLLENQLAGVTGPARNVYMQRLPFQTLLNVEGELLQPEISFDIRLPERNYTVPAEVVNNTRARLAQLRQDPTELNKQVFALLILNRFIGENPFAGESGGLNPEAMARQSASRMLTQQLNALSAGLIKGIDIEFDLVSQEDFSTGQQEMRTDLSVGLSRQFFDNRLKVSIGSTFELEGSDNNNQNASHIAGDILIDYMLSKDGRFRLQAFRQNQYEVALQGQVVETGVSFVITTDYDTFKEIFQRQNTRKKRNKQNEK
jgi:hypothetical protein